MGPPWSPNEATLSAASVPSYVTWSATRYRFASTCSPTNPAHPLTKSDPDRCRTGHGMLRVAHALDQMPDVVHQPGHGELRVVRKLGAQDRCRLERMVEVCEGHRGTGTRIIDCSSRPRRQQSFDVINPEGHRPFSTPADARTHYGRRSMT